ESPSMQAVLAKNEVSDFMTDGLQIHTTLDADIQKASEYATYANLSRLDLILRGYHPPKDSQASLVSHFVPGAFYTGKVVSLSAPGKDGIPGAIELSFGSSRAEIAPAAIQRF